MSNEQGEARIDRRVTAHVVDSDLGWVTEALSRQRDRILSRWLDLAAEQSFHAGHREHAVADHIPLLLDGLIEFLRRGAPRHETSGAPLDDVVVLDAARAHAGARLEQGLQPVDVVVEFRLLRQEILGALRVELPDGVPTGDVIAALLLVNDTLDGAIALALRALADLVESVREDFLATTIHEVRQPLTLIKGAAQVAARLLGRPGSDVERILVELRRVDAEATRMATLLSQLVDASRIALDHLTLRIVPTDLTSLVGEVSDELGADTAARVRLTLDPGAGPTGHWDPDRLRQVLRNILGNAVKYSPAGTPIDVAILPREEDMIELRVQDHGIGLAPEELPRLFQRYARTERAVASGVEGLGLGLYLCRGIVQAHGGRIWATSPGPGQGTTFHTILPRRAVSRRAGDVPA